MPVMGIDDVIFPCKVILKLSLLAEKKITEKTGLFVLVLLLLLLLFEDAPHFGALTGLELTM